MPNHSNLDPSGSLVERFLIEPIATGPLYGLDFTVKDNIDIAGRKTSYGNPTWRDHHHAPKYNALCVDQLLAAGGRCVGKVVADEFTYSLDGESQFFGTPRNAKAPNRIPGGSSSGSVASVANGVSDFSIGTDSGGSIRVPASLCGVWGMRPSLHRISEAGVMPFMPSVSTVGAVASSYEQLNSVIRVLLRSGGGLAVPLQRILVLSDAMEIADKSVRAAAEVALNDISSRTGVDLQTISFAQIAGDGASLSDCNENALRVLQSLEFQNTVGNWIENNTPEISNTFSMAYENVRQFNRYEAMNCLDRCERFFDAIQALMTCGTVICFPTTPVIAPLKNTLNSMEAVMDFYGRTMNITAFSGVGRLPEISAPLLTVEDCPVGLSFAAGHYQDEFLLSAVKKMLGW
ncbi:amidase family protein [Cohaesibacter celericrescens]|uniref:Glutamyl-tRNA amidotransferase n=1 Tax=Cohaesibacter celericrescens TaxID=2067669 RepID=A0A2N5XQ09_9HYPH|nr:amidase family protein [Cohaesibacter celericrescens]PLW76527.1 glutamyl-tRNA amidotransferase [Cohaesibacter celericrescens]